MASEQNRKCPCGSTNLVPYYREGVKVPVSYRCLICGTFQEVKPESVVPKNEPEDDAEKNLQKAIDLASIPQDLVKKTMARKPRQEHHDGQWIPLEEIDLDEQYFRGHVSIEECDWQGIRAMLENWYAIHGLDDSKLVKPKDATDADAKAVYLSLAKQFKFSTKHEWAHWGLYGQDEGYHCFYPSSTQARGSFKVTCITYEGLVPEPESCLDCQNESLQLDPKGPCMGDQMCTIVDGHKTHFKAKTSQALTNEDVSKAIDESISNNHQE